PLGVSDSACVSASGVAATSWGSFSPHAVSRAVAAKIGRNPSTERSITDDLQISGVAVATGADAATPTGTAMREVRKGYSSAGVKVTRPGPGRSGPAAFLCRIDRPRYG